MTVLARAPEVSDAQLAAVTAIFEAVGRCVELDDAQMDAVTALNGSGPAFVYVMIEALTDGGVMMGLPRDRALQIAASVFEGAAGMVLQSGAHPAALKDDVTTPAGCTIAGAVDHGGRSHPFGPRPDDQEATNVASRLGGAAAEARTTRPGFLGGRRTSPSPSSPSLPSWVHGPPMEVGAPDAQVAGRE